MKIKFKSIKEQRNYLYEGDWGLDDSLIPYVHVLIGNNLDYTLCSQATDEYLFDKLSDNIKVTCEKCKQHILECREIKL